MRWRSSSFRVYRQQRARTKVLDCRKPTSAVCDGPRVGHKHELRVGAGPLGRTLRSLPAWIQMERGCKRSCSSYLDAVPAGVSRVFSRYNRSAK